MRKFDPRRDLMRKTMIAVAASLAIGTATMAIGTVAFAHGGGGGHFGGGGGHVGGGGHFAGGHFGRGFGGSFLRGPYGFDDEGLYYGYGNGSCYVLTPSGYVWACF
jgi:hypothetical protein